MMMVILPLKREGGVGGEFSLSSDPALQSPAVQTDHN